MSKSRLVDSGSTLRHRVRGRPFQPGPDPRRHRFTPEESHRGKVGALWACARRGPECLAWLRSKLWAWRRRRRGERWRG